MEVYKSCVPCIKRQIIESARMSTDEEMFIIRYSQNGPYLTIKFEAKTEERYNFLKDYIRKLLQTYEEVDWSSTINVNVESLR